MDSAGPDMVVVQVGQDIVAVPDKQAAPDIAAGPVAMDLAAVQAGGAARDLAAVQVGPVVQAGPVVRAELAGRVAADIAAADTGAHKDRQSQPAAPAPLL